jgi:hypothetical protein
MEQNSGKYCTLKFYSGCVDSPDGYFDKHFTIYKVENEKAVYVIVMGKFVGEFSSKKAQNNIIN